MTSVQTIPGLTRAALVTGHGKPGSGLPLCFGDFARGHLERNLGAAFLPPGAARQCRQIEPFMRFDEIDRDAPASGRKGYSKLE